MFRKSLHSVEVDFYNIFFKKQFCIRLRRLVFTIFIAEKAPSYVAVDARSVKIRRKNLSTGE